MEDRVGRSSKKWLEGRMAVKGTGCSPYLPLTWKARKASWEVRAASPFRHVGAD